MDDINASLSIKSWVNFKIYTILAICLWSFLTVQILFAQLSDLVLVLHLLGRKDLLHLFCSSLEHIALVVLNQLLGSNQYMVTCAI